MSAVADIGLPMLGRGVAGVSPAEGVTENGALGPVAVRGRRSPNDPADGDRTGFSVHYGISHFRLLFGNGMAKDKKAGVTPTERFLADLCSRSFLRLWSYANPFKDDGHEFCDVLAVFENHVFIFFDREKQLADLTQDEDPQTRWDRWKRGTIDKQITTARGAERYLRSGRRIYLDAKKTKEFPIKFDMDTIIVHKIIVAHGAVEACKNFSDSNIYGSLALSYGDSSGPSSWPFMIHLDRHDPVHVFDSHNLPIVLGELDTIKDFSDYLDAKVRAIATYNMLGYCGEEDLLAHYLLNLDPVSKRHYIGTSDTTINAFMVGEGEWQDFIALPQYQATKAANEASYLWDNIITKTSGNWHSGTLLGDGQLLSGKGAIHEMAKEPRFMRRESAERILNAIRTFPEDKIGLSRHLCFFSSYYSDKAYVFLQLWVPPPMRGQEADYRAKRQEILRIACGAAKNKFPQLATVIGICVPPPKLERQIGEDFVWLGCNDWSDETKAEYERLNADWNFFETGTYREKTTHEFVLPDKAKTQPKAAMKKKTGRNELCPCGSGKKYKKCHGP